MRRAPAQANILTEVFGFRMVWRERLRSILRGCPDSRKPCRNPVVPRAADTGRPRNPEKRPVRRRRLAAPAEVVATHLRMDRLDEVEAFIARASHCDGRRRGQHHAQWGLGPAAAVWSCRRAAGTADGEITRTLGTSGTGKAIGRMPYARHRRKCRSMSAFTRPPSRPLRVPACPVARCCWMTWSRVVVSGWRRQSGTGERMLDRS
jgi:hypothetical protein